MKKILVTGASGFIGQNICEELIKLNWPVCGTVRNSDSLSINNDFKYISVGDIGPKTNWDNALKGIDCVVHCAGKAHEMNNDNDLDTYHLVNTEGTRHLAEKAAEAGVKRLVFLSTVKVNGENIDKINNNKIFTNNDTPDPKDAYSISKLEAETILWEISSRTDLEVVVVRLPLVYGRGVKGNLKRLIKLINFGIPLPFSLITNQRSLIGIDNLVSVLIRCVENLEAKGKTFLVSDDKDLSTPNLLQHIASAMGRSAHLFPVPISLLKFFGFVLGRQSEMNRLLGSLQVDISYTREILNWTPPISVEEGIKRMVQGE